jgi:O-antigen/teichoic acid export membrane protein
VTFGSFLANGGFGAALMGQAARPAREDLATVLGFQLVLMVGFAVVVGAIGLSLGTMGAVAALMTVTLPLDALRVPAAILAERELRYRPIVVAQVTEMVAYYAWAISAAALGVGVWAIASAAVVRALIGSVTLVAAVPEGIVRPRLSLRRLRRLFGFGARFQAVGAVNLLRDQGLNAAVATIAGVTALGLWSLAFRLIQGIIMLFETLWRVSFPAMARLLGAGEDARPLLARGVGVTATAAGFLVVGIGGSAPALVPTVFGARWADAASILPWAAVGVGIAGSLTACAAGYFYAVGDARTALRATTIHTIVWFAVSLPLLSVMGVEALGIGWLVSCLADYAVFSTAVRRRTGLNVLGVLAPPVMCAILGMAGGLAVAMALPTGPGGVIASLATAETVYCLAIVTTVREPLLDLVGMISRAVRPANVGTP